jgi:hypothetical protein
VNAGALSPTFRTVIAFLSAECACFCSVTRSLTQKNVAGINPAGYFLP